MAQTIIDTHVHVWNFERTHYAWLDGDTSILARSYHLEELEESRRCAGVTGGVLVQAANNTEDTEWMLEVATASSWIKGVVGWLPLTEPAAVAKMLAEEYRHNNYFKGVRHLIHDEADPRWLLQEEVVESLRILAAHDLPFDVVGVKTEHIETALAVAAKVPKLRMVFDHLNQPPIAAKERYGRWGELLKEAAKHPQFFAKISGLGTASKRPDWSAEDIRPYVAFALEQFGSDRCFCGGDWPVALLAGSYEQTWQTYKDVLHSLLPSADLQKVYADNAVSFYRL